VPSIVDLGSRGVRSGNTWRRHLVYDDPRIGVQCGGLFSPLRGGGFRTRFLERDCAQTGSHGNIDVFFWYIRCPGVRAEIGNKRRTSIHNFPQ